MNMLKVVIVCVVAVFSAASLFVTLLGNRRRSSLLPEVPIVASPAEVRVKAVERNSAANVATAATAAFLNKATSSVGNCGIIPIIRKKLG